MIALMTVGSVPASAGDGARTGATEQTAATVPDNAVATVNGEAVLLEDLERQLAEIHGAAATGSRTGFDVDQLIFRIVNDVLLGQEARAMGLDEEVTDKVDAFLRNAARSRLKYVEIEEKSRPTEDEIRRTFEDQYRRATFRVVTAYEEQEAEELLALVREGADIESLARERSKDPYAIRGGLVDDVPNRDLQRGIAAIVFDLEPGEIAGPIRTDLGWSVIKLESTAPADPARFEGLRPLIASIVHFNKSEARKRELAEQIRAKFTVTIDREVAGSVKPESQPDGRILPMIDENARDAVVARIGDDLTITAGEYAQALIGRWKGIRNIETARAAAPVVLDRLVRESLLLAEALSRGYAEEPAVQRAAWFYETRLLIPKYLQETVAPGIVIEQEEIEAYYEEHKNQFLMPPRLNLAQITVATEGEARRIAALASEGSDFGWLAKKHSTDRFKETGGRRGWTTARPGGDPFQQWLLSAKPGDVHEPVGVEDNFVVIKVIDREEQGPYPFESISGNVRQALQTQKEREAIDTLIKVLRSRSEITINDDLLASLRITGTVEEGAHEAGGHGH